jgi:hypothetical protein
MSTPQGQEAAKVKRESSPEVMETDSEQYAGNPHQAVAKILNDERIGGLDENTFREVEKYVSALLLNGQASTLSSFGCLLDSKISLVSYVRFLENAALPFLEGRGNEQSKELPEVKREEQRESSSGGSPSVEGLNASQIKIISDSRAKMAPLPENMGCYDSWIRIMRAILRIDDESLWPNDIDRIRGVLALSKRILSQSKGFSARRRENFLRYAISAVQLPIKTFWTGLHASITYETPFTVKWCNLRMYGGWPGFDQLELRMNTIARVSFGVSGWSVIKDLQPFLHILCAMTPVPIWKRLMEMGVEDAKDYLEKCIKIRDHPQFPDRQRHNYSEVMKYTFGVPSPEEVDKVGMGTLSIDPRIELSGERDSFIYNPFLLSYKNYGPRFHQSVNLMMCDEIKAQGNLTGNHFKNQPADIYTKWETLRVRGGWPGFGRLSYRMDVIAREMFGASRWKDLNIHPAFLHVLAAMTPTPLWTYMTRYMVFHDAKGYYEAVMSLRDKPFAQPLVMKRMFGVPLPFEADRLGFGTHYVNPSKDVGPEFLSNPIFQVCEDCEPIFPSQVKKLPEVPLIRYAAGVIGKPSNLPQPSLMHQLPCPENATIEIPPPGSGNRGSHQLALAPSSSEVQQSTAVVTSQAQSVQAAPLAQASNSRHSSQGGTPNIPAPNSVPSQNQVPRLNSQPSSQTATSEAVSRPNSQPFQQTPQAKPSEPAAQPTNSNAPAQSALAVAHNPAEFSLTQRYGKVISCMTKAEVAQLSKTQRKKMKKEEMLMTQIRNHKQEVQEKMAQDEQQTRKGREEGERKRHEEEERKKHAEEERRRREEEEKRKREEAERKRGEEEERKKHAEEERKGREEEERRKPEEEERRKREEEERRKHEEEERRKREGGERRKREEEERRKREEDVRRKREEEVKRRREEDERRIRLEEQRKRKEAEIISREEEAKRWKAAADEKKRAQEEKARASVEGDNKTPTENEHEKKQQHKANRNNTNDTNKQQQPTRKLGEMPPLGNNPRPPSQTHPQRKLGDMPPLGHGHSDAQGKPNQPHYQHYYQPYNHHQPPWKQRQEQLQQKFQQSKHQRQQQPQQYRPIPPWENRKQASPSHHQLGGHQLGGYKPNTTTSPVIDLSDSPTNSPPQVPAGPRKPWKPNEPNDHQQQQQSGTTLASRIGLPKRPRNEWDSFAPDKRSKNS